MQPDGQGGPGAGRGRHRAARPAAVGHVRAPGVLGGDRLGAGSQHRRAAEPVRGDQPVGGHVARAAARPARADRTGPGGRRRVHLDRCERPGVLQCRRRLPHQLRVLRGRRGHRRRVRSSTRGPAPALRVAGPTSRGARCRRRLHHRVLRSDGRPPRGMEPLVHRQPGAGRALRQRDALGGGPRDGQPQRLGPGGRAASRLALRGRHRRAVPRARLLRRGPLRRAARRLVHGPVRQVRCLPPEQRRARDLWRADRR